MIGHYFFVHDTFFDALHALSSLLEYFGSVYRMLSLILYEMLPSRLDCNICYLCSDCWRQLPACDNKHKQNQGRLWDAKIFFWPLRRVIAARLK